MALASPRRMRVGADLRQACSNKPWPRWTFRGEELTAWMGPAISKEHFEVGEEVRAEFVDADPEAAAAFAPNARGRWQADLVGLARRRLSALGVTDVSGGQWCTFTDRERFYSHRRDGKGGRMAALIWRDSRNAAKADARPFKSRSYFELNYTNCEQ